MMQKSTSTIGLSSCSHIIHPCKVICQLGQAAILGTRDILINWLIEIGFRFYLIHHSGPTESRNQSEEYMEFQSLASLYAWTCWYGTSQLSDLVRGNTSSNPHWRGSCMVTFSIATLMPRVIFIFFIFVFLKNSFSKSISF